MSGSESPAPVRRPLGIRILVVVIGIILPVVVILGGLELAKWMMETGPEAQRKKPKRRARLVEVVTAAAEDITTSVPAMGTVRAAREVVLRPRVAGEIITVSERFLPGGRFATGDVILTIDPRDYELEVERRESELLTARANLDLEKGNQEIARREFELLGQDIPEADRGLILRGPQLAIVRARLKLAENALDVAKLALARTQIRAPFSCLVQDRSVNLGAQVSTSTPLATLLGAGELWVEVSVPVNRLTWIALPESVRAAGAGAVVIDPAGGRHQGSVLSLTGSLETEGRMARLLVTVTEPPRTDGTGLLIGSYVRVEIQGRKLTDVIALPSRLLRDGNTVWILSEGGTLEIRPVEIAFTERDRLFVSRGLSAGDLIVASDLGAPVAGMPLRRSGDGPGETAEAPK